MRRLPLAAILAVAACSSVPVTPPDGPSVARIAVVERGWHTDICMPHEDASPGVLALAAEFPGVRTICLGFGDRQYVVAHEHDVLTMAGALLPSRGALLLTALSATPQAAFGATHVARLDVSRAGLAGLNVFLRRSVQDDAAGRALRLAAGPYPGSAFFAATETYDGFYTCNSWTADALRSAGVPVTGGTLFAGAIMHEVRRIAAAEARS